MLPVNSQIPMAAFQMFLIYLSTVLGLEHCQNTGEHTLSLLSGLECHALQLQEQVSGIGKA